MQKITKQNEKWLKMLALNFGGNNKGFFLPVFWPDAFMCK